jgi:uncharacterized protein
MVRAQTFLRPFEEEVVMYRHPQLDQILSELRTGLEALYGERLVKLVLYGSQARGDAEEYSDVDVLAVLRDKFDRKLEDQRTLDLICHLTLKHSVVVSLLLIPYEDYHANQIGLVWNIHREGVLV